MPFRTVTALVAAALTLGVAASPVAANEGEPEVAAPRQIDIVLAPAEPVLDPEADEYQFTLLVDNASGEEELPEGSLTFALAPVPVAKPEQLREAPAVVAPPFFEARVPATSPEEQRIETFSVPADAFPLDDNEEPGVYLIEATAVFGEDELIASSSAISPIVWEEAAEPGAPLAMIVPFVLPSNIHAMPSRNTLAEVAPGLIALLDEAEAQLATLAIDPRIIAGARAYGEEAPPRAAELLERLETSPRPSFLLQFADADPAAQAALGRDSLLQPEDLGYVTRHGTFPQPEDGIVDADADALPDPEQTTEPTEQDAEDAQETQDPQGDAGADPPAEGGEAPTLEQLLDWPQQEQASAWPAEGQASTKTLSLLGAYGIEHTVLSSDNVRLAKGPLATLGDGSAVITDAPLGAAMRDAIAAETEAERAAALAYAAAELAIAALEERPGVVLGLDRGAVGDAVDPAAAIAQLAELDLAIPTPVSQLAEGKATLQETSSPGEERLAALQAAIDRQPQVNEVGAVLHHPEYFDSYQRDRLLEFFATRHASSAADFDAVAEAFSARDTELQQGVHTVSSDHIQLVGASTLLPVQLNNALPFAAAVTVHAAPASAALSVPERVFEEITVPGSGSERVMIPVRTRVSSGESSLGITVTDATGDYVSSESSLPISIRSNYGRIALWALGGIAGLLFVFGIIRSLRRRTKAQ